MGSKVYPLLNGRENVFSNCKQIKPDHSTLKCLEIKTVIVPQL